MGKLLIIAGVICIMAGLFVMYQDKIPFIGRLPGDIRIEKENFKFYFPLTTSILLSIIVSLLVYLFNALKR
jgi:hypothetical protein